MVEKKDHPLQIQKHLKYLVIIFYIPLNLLKKQQVVHIILYFHVHYWFEFAHLNKNKIDDHCHLG